MSVFWECEQQVIFDMYFLLWMGRKEDEEWINFAWLHGRNENWRKLELVGTILLLEASVIRDRMSVSSTFYTFWDDMLFLSDSKRQRQSYGVHRDYIWLPNSTRLEYWFFLLLGMEIIKDELILWTE